MKQISVLVFVVFVCLLWVLGRPGSALKQGGEEREAQEVREEQLLSPEMQEENPDLRDSPAVRVIFQVTEQQEEAIADIIWLKKAAATALERGSPYFNVLEQHITKKFSRQLNMRISTVEGLIELAQDPMEAEYDAHEIDSLILSDTEE